MQYRIAYAGVYCPNVSTRWNIVFKTMLKVYLWLFVMSFLTRSLLEKCRLNENNML